MNRIALVLAALALLASAPIGAAQISEWETFAPDTCPIRIAVPHAPSVMADSGEVEGRTLRSFIYDAREGMLSFSIRCMEHPFGDALATREVALEWLTGAARARVKGEPVSFDEVAADGFTGIAFQTPLGGGAVIYHRAFVLDSRIVLLDVGSLDGSGREDADRFFASFEPRR